MTAHFGDYQCIPHLSEGIATVLYPRIQPLEPSAPVTWQYMPFCLNPDLSIKACLYVFTSKFESYVYFQSDSTHLDAQHVQTTPIKFETKL